MLAGTEYSQLWTRARRPQFPRFWRLARKIPRRHAEGFERSLRKKLSVGDLMTMHKEGQSNSDETILQVVELNKDEIGNLHSITLSDSEYVSHNIKNFLIFLLSLHFFCGIRCQSYNYLENQFPEKIYSSNLGTKSILFKKLAAKWR